jgi:SAM-dependent methyltransferase
MLPQTPRGPGTVQWTGVTLDRLEQNWQALGEQDPLWAILSAPEKRGGGWELEEFLASGTSEITDVLRLLEDQRISVERDRALDFGCGVGRLTQALAAEFHSCDGVDLAASMVNRARELSRGSDRIHFHHNEAEDLGLFESVSFDFVLSLYVLQHMRPQLMRGYLREFVRVLRPNGIAYFNVPERTVLPEPVPRDAWRAELALAGPAPSFEAGGPAALELIVRNASQAAWPASAHLQIGNHWTTSAGERVPGDESRAPLEGAVAPGESRQLSLVAIAPSEPGEYELEIDLVQEGISWFGARGSEILRLHVRVDAGRRPPSDEHRPPPVIEMHTLTRAKVTEVVERAGGTVLAEIPLERCGPTRPSIDYVVGRRADGVPRRSVGRRMRGRLSRLLSR